MSSPSPDPTFEEHDRGLARDLLRLRLLDRRCTLGLLSAAMMLATRGSVGLAAAGDSCTAYPRETDGPYPADGTNRAPGATSNMLTMKPSAGGTSGAA